MQLLRSQHFIDRNSRRAALPRQRLHNLRRQMGQPGHPAQLWFGDLLPGGDILGGVPSRLLHLASPLPAQRDGAQQMPVRAKADMMPGILRRQSLRPTIARLPMQRLPTSQAVPRPAGSGGAPLAQITRDISHANGDAREQRFGRTAPCWARQPRTKLGLFMTQHCSTLTAIAAEKRNAVDVSAAPPPP